MPRTAVKPVCWIDTPQNSTTEIHDADHNLRADDHQCPTVRDRQVADRQLPDHLPLPAHAGGHVRHNSPRDRRGYTLVELMVVVTIILIVSAVALPTIQTGIQHRQVFQAAALLQAALNAARDTAAKNSSSGGIRLVLDANLPGTCSTIVPLVQPPNYQTGSVNIFPGKDYSVYSFTPPSNGNGQNLFLSTQALLIEGAITDANGFPVEPTNWNWNVRLGDQIQINNSGSWYTVVGPMLVPPQGGNFQVFDPTTGGFVTEFIANPEFFVNVGAPGTPLTQTLPNGKQIQIALDYLLVTDQRDDNANGWTDEGWDNVDNNGNNLTDEPAEWEVEQWQGYLKQGITLTPYVIRRRLMPDSPTKTLTLPSNMVVDLSRSNLPTTAITGTTVVSDIVINANGSMSVSLPYSGLASMGITSSFYQFWLAERGDVGGQTPLGQWWLISANGKTGRLASIEQPDLVIGIAAARQE
jgi:prepilin-type N-terminal cleavage/methylation domain-containing protein